MVISRSEQMMRFDIALAKNTYSQTDGYFFCVDSIAAELGIDISDPCAREWFTEFCSDQADNHLGPDAFVMQFSVNGVFQHYFPVENVEARN